MTVKEVYEIVQNIDKKLDRAIEKKEDKEDAEKKNSIIWKVMLSLFGVNLVAALGVIITIWLAM